MDRGLRGVEQNVVGQAPNDLGAIRLFSLRARADRTQPISVGLFFVRDQLNPCEAVEVKHRTDHIAYVAQDMDKYRLGEKLSQSVNIKRVLRGAVHPSHPGPRKWAPHEFGEGGDRGACSLQVLPVRAN